MLWHSPSRAGIRKELIHANKMRYLSCGKSLRWYETLSPIFCSQSAFRDPFGDRGDVWARKIVGGLGDFPL